MPTPRIPKVLGFLPGGLETHDHVGEHQGIIKVDDPPGVCTNELARRSRSVPRRPR